MFDKLTFGTVLRVKPRTVKTEEEIRKTGWFAIRDEETHTNVEDPSETDGLDHAAIMETLNPQAKCEAAPSTNAITSPLPEENGDATASNASYGTGKNEHATYGFGWGVDGG